MRIYDGIIKLIKELDPSIVIIDGLFNPGFDACYTLNQKFMISTPNAPTDVAKVHQPWLKRLWYYPAFVIPSNLVPKLGLTQSSNQTR